MAFMRAKMKSSLVIVLALGCGILAVFWPQWRGELRAQGYYPGFGAEGKVTTAFEDLAQARAVAIQTDGKIVAAGYAVLSGNQHFALVRYNTDGSLDTSFNGTGMLTLAIGTGDDTGFTLAQQADGKLVIGGYTVTGSTNDFALVRLASNGTLDAGFGTAGKVTTDISRAVLLLGKYAFDGNTHTAISSADAATMNCLAGALDDYNNDRPVRSCS